MAVDVQAKVARNKDLKRFKVNWNNHWQLVSEYVMTIKSDFTTTFEPGEFLNEELFDSTAPRANNIMASSMVGALWPSGANSFRFRAPKEIPDNRETKKFYEDAHQELASAMDEPEAGLTTALDEYMGDQGAFGTAGIAAFDGPQNNLEFPIMFQAWEVKNMAIAENQMGFVDTIYREKQFTIRQLELEYGLKKLGPESQEAFNRNDLDRKVKVLMILEPRDERDMTKSGSLSMPIASIHIELDGANTLLRESGFTELPVKIGRMRKKITERYGRSPAMDALPEILEINALREAIIIATEKELDPPLGVLDDGKLGTAIIDTSAKAINVFNVSGRLGNQNPIFPLVTVGDMRAAKEEKEELREAITNAFNIDRLLDLNNETQMTLGEAQIRNQLRGMTLGALFGRQVAEVFTPLIKRCFNILLAQGRLGVIRGSEEEDGLLLQGIIPTYIPDVIAKAMLDGKDIYKIEYLTPAQRMIDAEEVQGVIQSWQFANEMAAARPEVYDNLDEDESIRIVSKGTGAPNTILRDQKSVKDIRKARAVRQAELEKAQAAAQTADMVNKVGPTLTKQPQVV